MLQSAAVVQVFEQPVWAHAKGVQSCVLTTTHAPLPSQVETGVKTLPLHEASVQTTLVLALRQAPAPSQVPSFPHWLVPLWSVHALWALRPLVTGAQVPSDLPVSVWMQALHPVQALSQQTASAQTVEAQSLLAEQVAPWSAGTNPSGMSAGASIAASGAMPPAPPPLPPPLPIPPLLPPLPLLPPPEDGPSATPFASFMPSVAPPPPPSRPAAPPPNGAVPLEPPAAAPNFGAEMAVHPSAPRIKTPTIRL